MAFGRTLYMLRNGPEQAQRFVHTNMRGGGEPWARSQGSWSAWAKKARVVSMAYTREARGRK